jgi:hypothetical protein
MATSRRELREDFEQGVASLAPHVGAGITAAVMRAGQKSEKVHWSFRMQVMLTETERKGSRYLNGYLSGLRGWCEDRSELSPGASRLILPPGDAEWSADDYRNVTRQLCRL